MHLPNIKLPLSYSKLYFIVQIAVFKRYSAHAVLRRLFQIGAHWRILTIASRIVLFDNIQKICWIIFISIYLRSLISRLHWSNLILFVAAINPPFSLNNFVLFSWRVVLYNLKDVSSLKVALYFHLLPLHLSLATLNLFYPPHMTIL